MENLDAADIVFSGRTEVGPVRADNQDSIWFPAKEARPGDLALCAVADGMGGYAHGEIASAVALERLCQTFAENGNGASELKLLQRAVESANLSVYQEAQRLGARHMGTTLTAALISADRLYLAHVGDSRAYLIRDGISSCLTCDHTTVADLVRMGVISSQKARRHAQRSILTRSVGMELFVQPDLSQIRLLPGDRLVLCSDGVWSVIEDDEFGAVSRCSADADHLAQALIDLAIHRESDDNVSVIAVDVHSLSKRQARERKSFKLANLFHHP